MFLPRKKLEVAETTYPRKDSGWWSIVTRKERSFSFLCGKNARRESKALLVFPDFRALDYFTSFVENQFLN